MISVVARHCCTKTKNLSLTDEIKLILKRNFAKPSKREEKLAAYDEAISNRLSKMASPVTHDISSLSNFTRPPILRPEKLLIICLKSQLTNLTLFLLSRPIFPLQLTKGSSSILNPHQDLRISNSNKQIRIHISS
jgi:hypothetical protein